jgi:hypothetical protein
MRDLSDALQLIDSMRLHREMDLSSLRPRIHVGIRSVSLKA